MTLRTGAHTLRTIRLVAARELGTRLQSRAFQAATAIMLLAVVAAIVLPAMLRPDTPATRRIGLTGPAPEGLPAALTVQAAATGSRVELLTPARLDERILARGDPGRATTEAAAFAMLVMLFTAITVYGGQVLTGVVEEKATRVVELLLTRMPPWQLLAGKVLGIGLLALGQLLLVAIAAGVSAAAVDTVDVPRLGADLVAWLLVWFVAGFALWSVVYGALGALASRSEDAQTVSAPATVALLLTIAAIYALVRLGGRVYAGALLRIGGKVRLRDAWRAGGADMTVQRAPRRRTRMLGRTS